eukprot:scaffold51478_cov96-Cyclotella_meneghiniana.AAC.1
MGMKLVVGNYPRKLTTIRRAKCPSKPTSVDKTKDPGTDFLIEGRAIFMLTVLSPTLQKEAYNSSTIILRAPRLNDSLETPRHPILVLKCTDIRLNL